MQIVGVEGGRGVGGRSVGRSGLGWGGVVVLTELNKTGNVY